MFLWITISRLEYLTRNKLTVRSLRKMMSNCNTKVHSIRERLMQMLKEEDQEEAIA